MCSASNVYLQFAAVPNVQLRVEGQSARIHALAGVAHVPAGWPVASTAHQGVINITHYLQHSSLPSWSHASERLIRLCVTVSLALSTHGGLVEHLAMLRSNNEDSSLHLTCLYHARSAT